MIFSFPKDPDRRREWMRSLQLPESLDLFYRRVCSKHFSREDFVKCGNTGRRMLLKKTSLPRLNTSKEDLPLKKTLNYFAKFGRLRKNRRLAHSCYICGANRDEAASYFKSVILELYKISLKNIYSIFMLLGFPANRVQNFSGWKLVVLTLTLLSTIYFYATNIFCITISSKMKNNYC